MGRKTIIIVLSVTLVILAAGIAVPTWLVNSDPFRHWVVARVNRTIAGHMAVADISFDMFPGRLSLSQVQVYSADDEPLIQIDHCRILIAWSALLRRQIHLPAVVVQGVRLFIGYNVQDRLILEQALAPSGSTNSAPGKSGGTPWALRVDEVRLSDGHIAYSRPARQLAAEIESLAVQGSIDTAAGRGEADVKVPGLHVKGFGIDQTVHGLSLRAIYDKAADRPWQIALQSPSSRLSAQGEVRVGGPVPELDGSAQADLDLAEISPWIPFELGMQGRLTTDVSIKGPVNDPRVNVDLSVASAAALGIHAEALSAKGTLDKRIIALSVLSGRGAWGRLDLTGRLNLQSMFPTDFFNSKAGVEALGYDLSVQGQALQPWRLADLPVAWIGTWQGSARLQGQGLPGSSTNMGQGTVDLKVSGIRLAPAGQPVDGTIGAEVHWDGAVLDVVQSRVAIPDHALVTTGRLDLARGQLQADGHLNSENIAALGRAMGIALPEGVAQVKLKARGPLARPRVTADMLAQDLRLASYTFGRLLVSAELDSALNLNFPRLVLENKGSYMEGSGHLALADADPAAALALEFDSLDPNDFMDFSGLKAFFKGHLELSGSLKNLHGQLNLKPSPLTWGAYKARVQGAVQWQKGRLSISQLTLDRGASKLEVQGHMLLQDPQSGRWLDDPRVELDAHGDSMHLEDFWADFKGRLSISMALDGPLSNPSGRFEISGRELDVKAQKFSAFHAAGLLKERVLHVSELAIDLAHDQVISGKGSFTLDRRFDFQLNGRDLDLSRIQSLQGEYPVDGLLEMTVHGTGSIADPAISAEVAVHHPKLGDQPFEDFDLKAKLMGRRLSVNGKLNFDLTADSDLASGDFSLDAHFDKTDLSPLISLMAGAHWQGLLSGDVTAAGNWHVWHRIQARVLLSHAALSYNKQAVVVVPGMSLDFQDGVVRLPSTRIEILKQGQLTVSASGNVAKNFNVTADGQVPVAALAFFLEDPEDAAGQVTLHAGAQGPWNAIQWQIDAELAGVGFPIPYLSQNVHDVRGKLHVTSNQLTVSGFSGKIEEGVFSLQGAVKLKAFQPVQGSLTLTLDKLPVQVPDTMDIKINGDLTLTGARSQALLQGTLTLLEGTYYKDLRLNLWSMVSVVTESKRSQPVPQTADKPQWMENIALDVTLNHRYPLQVDNNIANLDIVPDLKLTGTAARPILSGRATVTEGVVTFRGKSFPVTRGVVDFVNPNKIEPSLDLYSEAQIRGWLVHVSVSGTPDQLVVKLSSDPALAENDILSLILFGRTNAELTSGQGGATTQQMLAGLLASALGEDVKKTTGVDILEVDTGAKAAEDSADRIAVTVGKKLTERMTVKYVVESNNGEMIQRAVSEYRFMENVLASGFQDSKGRYGGELLFRLEFR